MSSATTRLEPGPSTAAPAAPRRLSRLGPDLAYLLTGLPVAVASFSLLLTGISAASGLLGGIVTVPLAMLAVVATLAVARAFAAVERARLRWVGALVPDPVRLTRPGRPSRSRVGRAWERWLTWVADPQQWFDLLHGVLVLPLAVATWTIAVTWPLAALGGLTRWYWQRWLPDQGGRSLADQAGLPFSDGWLDAVLGLLLLVTLVPVLRGCALAHVGLGRLLLGNHHLRALQDRVAALTASRAAAVEAEASALRTLERDLHDGPQQRLVRLDMDLAAAQRRLGQPGGAADVEAARELVAQARTQSAEALAELRALSRGIAPPVLVDRGLVAALTAVVTRCPVPTSLDTDLAEGARLPAAVESSAYYVVSEALTNVAKHSGAQRACVRISREADALRVGVWDDGTGGAHPGKGHGIAGLTARLGALDATLVVTSPEGGPTLLEAVIPCG